MSFLKCLKTLNIFAFIFFTYSRKYFGFYVAKCQSEVCIILFSNAIAT